MSHGVQRPICLLPVPFQSNVECLFNFTFDEKAKNNYTTRESFSQTQMYVSYLGISQYDACIQ